MSVRILQAHSRIKARLELNAFIALTAEEGSGAIVAVKDMIDVAGMTTTRGTRLSLAPAQHDAEVVARIRAIQRTCRAVRPAAPQSPPACAIGP